MERQRVRKLLLMISMLLFPVTLYYFSPALIINAGLEGIINGSFIVFALLLLSSIFFGRSFCGYICPAGGLQECAFAVNDKTPKLGRRRFVKYIIWVMWIAVVIFCYLSQGQIAKIDFFYQTQNGISVYDVSGYIIYYGIVLLVILPAIISGKRAFCHYFCWMAPFMAIGTKIRGLFHLPGLHIAASKEKCVSCGKCRKACPMGIDTDAMVMKEKCDSVECIQCGACIDACTQKALGYRLTNNG